MEIAATKSATSNTSEERSQRTESLFDAVVRGIAGAWLGVALQLAVTLSLGHGRVAGVWELQHGLLGFAPAWLLLALLPGAAAGVASRTVRGQASSAQLWLIGAAFGALLGWGIGGGRHLSDPLLRGGFAAALAASSAFAMAAAARALRFALQRWPGRSQLWLPAMGLLGAAFIESINGLVLVRLYPAFHAGLSFLALFVFATAWSCSGVGTAARGARAAVVATALAALGLVWPLSRQVSGFDNFRWLIVENSPTLALGTDLSARIAPPPRMDASAAQLPLGARKTQSAVDFRGRSILLVTVDALRADHVGAYGYARNTTPALDRLARSGVRFDAAYAATPHTSYSVTSLMTGKYMRPLLLQGAGRDSDLWAELLQTYEYRTAGFYPPAVFFIDRERFESFENDKLGFEYAKVEFAEGDKRLGQVEKFLEGEPPGQKVFIWVHLFGPHEPYETHQQFDFGPRDMDRYDSEVRAADETIGRVVDAFRARHPRGVVMVSSDHGEEFGDHGGRYHGTTVYEEQIRVPLVVNAAGLPEGEVVEEPVQTIDLLPTTLSALQIPIPPRIRGRDLTPLLVDETAGQGLETTGQGVETTGLVGEEPGQGIAVAETDAYSFLARGPFRLICQRGSGACQLFHLPSDPRQKSDVSAAHPDVFQRLKAQARTMAASHGEYEAQGLRAEGKGWPDAIVRGLSGDADVAPELARLLEDADQGIRKKAAQLLFELGSTAQAPALRIAMRREESPEVREWLALALTRLGQGAPLVMELLAGEDQHLSRLAALALAEQGDDAGEDVLLRWWSAEPSHEEAIAILEALREIRSRDAVTPLLLALDDVRLRPAIAEALAAIGDREAMPHLALALSKERYHSVRSPLARAAAELGANDELIVPLRRFLGVPDPMGDGLELALQAGILDDVGGPEARATARLEQLSDSGVQVDVIVPGAPRQKATPPKVRLLALVRNHLDRPAHLLVEPGVPRVYSKDTNLRVRNLPEIHARKSFKIMVPPGEDWRQVWGVLPSEFGAQPGHRLWLELFSEQGLEVKAVAAVPLRAELPPPPPEPWNEEATGEEN